MTTDQVDNSEQVSEFTDSASATDKIDVLDVNDSWKKTFKLIEKAEPKGVLKFKNIDQLSSSEHRKLMQNFKAFFFSAFYYLGKKMYRKGLLILGAACIYSTILLFVEQSFSITLPAVIYYTPPSVVSSMLANYDYYQKMVNNKRMWEHMEIFNRWYPCVAFAVGSLLLLVFSA